MIIVHVQTRWVKGGAEENVMASCQHQMAQGHEVIAIHGSHYDESMRDMLSKSVSRVITVDSLLPQISPVDDFRCARQLTRIFNEIKPDLVHTHNSKAGVLGRIAAKRAGVPMVIHGVHILPFVNVGKLEEVVYLAAERFCARLTDAFISVSPSVRDACVERGIGRPERHFVALSAMDVARFKNPLPANDWREVLNVAPGAERPPTAVMIAAFEARKRQIELIEALPAALAQLDDWRMLFVGSGETEAEARALVDRLGLADKIRFAGFRRDPEAMIAIADIGVLTSLREGLPRVVVQYAAAGLPTVASELPSIEDVVEDGVSAIITPSSDIVAAAQAIGRLLGDRAERERLAAGARAIDVDAWLPERMNAAIDEAYRYCRPSRNTPDMPATLVDRYERL